MSELIVATETAVSDGDTGQFVMARVGSQDIAFAIQDVRDAVEPHAITPIPLAPSAIAGVMNLRGRIVTVIDLRRILDGDGEDGGSKRQNSHTIGITVDRHEGPFTLLVDSVSEVRRIDRSRMEAPPVTLDAALTRLCTGVFKLPGRLVVLLDVDRILDPETILATPTLAFRPRSRAMMIEDRQPKREASVVAPDAAKDAGPASREPPPPAIDSAPIQSNLISGDSIRAPDDAPAESGAARSVLAKIVPAPPKPRVAVPILDGIGGEAALSRLVAAFYEEVLSDPPLAGFFAEVDMPMQRGRMVAALGRLLAIPGSNYAAAALGFDWLVPKKVMEDEHFNRCLAHFERVLERQRIADTFAERILTAIEWCREGVVD